MDSLPNEKGIQYVAPDHLKRVLAAASDKEIQQQAAAEITRRKTATKETDDE